MGQKNTNLSIYNQSISQQKLRMPKPDI